MNSRIFLALIATLFFAALPAPAQTPAQSPAPESPESHSPDAVATAPRPATAPSTEPAASPRLAERVLIVSVDGMRPDMMLRCDTPNMHALFRSGTFSFWARTVPHALTLPSHTSMLTGVMPRKHEIEWNIDLPLKVPVYPKYPTLFEVAHKHGYTTAMAAGKSKFHTLAKPGTLDWEWITDSTKAEDPDVTEQAVEIIREHQPQVMFVHLPTTDNVGHAKGWGTHAQEKAVAGADEEVGKILAALDDAKVRDKTVVILTSDHGGAGLTHLPDDARARHIVWIAAGLGIRKDVDLTSYADLTINTEDTFATACYLLGLPRSPRLDGKPIKEILENAGELIHDGPQEGPATDHAAAAPADEGNPAAAH